MKKLIELLKGTKGKSDFPWFWIIIGVPILINLLGNDDEEVKTVDTTDKEKSQIIEKTAEQLTELTEDVQNAINEAKKEYDSIQKQKQIEKDEKQREVDKRNPFEDSDDRFNSEDLFK